MKRQSVCRRFISPNLCAHVKIATIIAPRVGESMNVGVM